MVEVPSLQPLERAQLQGHQVQHNDALHLLIIDGVVVACTPNEYEMLLLLLSHAGDAVPFARLLGVPGQRPLSRRSRRGLTQHISRLRARLWPFDLDILCLTSYGYLLLSRPNGQADNA